MRYTIYYLIFLEMDFKEGDRGRKQLMKLTYIGDSFFEGLTDGQFYEGKRQKSKGPQYRCININFSYLPRRKSVGAVRR